MNLFHVQSLLGHSTREMTRLFAYQIGIRGCSGIVDTNSDFLSMRTSTNSAIQVAQNQDPIQIGTA